MSSENKRDDLWWFLYMKHGSVLNVRCFDKALIARTRVEELRKLFVREDNWYFLKIPKDYPQSGCMKPLFFGCDWMKKEKLPMIKATFENDLDSWKKERMGERLYKPVSKGIVRTANYLFFMEDEVYRAAVWMKALLTEHYDYLALKKEEKEMRYVDMVLRSVSEYLKYECEWPNYMRHLVPFFDVDIDRVQFDSIEDVFGFAGECLNMARNDYGFMLYLTMDENGEVLLPDSLEGKRKILLKRMECGGVESMEELNNWNSMF